MENEVQAIGEVSEAVLMAVRAAAPREGGYLVLVVHERRVRGIDRTRITVHNTVTSAGSGGASETL